MFHKFKTKRISIFINDHDGRHSIYCYCEWEVKFENIEVNLTDHNRIRKMFAYFVILRASVYTNIIIRLNLSTFLLLNGIIIQNVSNIKSETQNGNLVENITIYILLITLSAIFSFNLDIVFLKTSSHYTWQGACLLCSVNNEV